jgi:hypothetical protein
MPIIVPHRRVPVNVFPAARAVVRIAAVVSLLGVVLPGGRRGG